MYTKPSVDLAEFQNTPVVFYPENNPNSDASWILGKKLFFDKRLSRDNSISCASCHKPELAFSDNVSKSLGVESRIGRRNSPSLGNIGMHPYFTRDGGVPSLEMQVFVPIQEHDEFDFNMVLAVERLSQDSGLNKLGYLAYGRAFDAFVLTSALGNFQRSLISDQSRFDQYAKGAVPNALSTQELEGMKLFFSTRTNCTSCHSGFNFTNYSFQNNGLYEEYMDPGRMRLTGKLTDEARFKVPSLRNVAITGPYMHDGSLNTLEEVVRHYNSGGQNHPNKGEPIKPLNLSEEEINNLIAFLESLTDETFINNQKFRP